MLRNVIVKRLALVVDGRKDEQLDLTGDVKQIKKKASVTGFDQHYSQQLTLSLFRRS